MGQRQDQTEIVYGNDCDICFDPGKTPKYVYARFSGIEICTGAGFEKCHVPPNDRTFKLTQVDGTPCSWYYLSDLWNIYYSAWKVADEKCRLKIEDDLSLGVFEQTISACPQEGTVFYNTLGCVPDSSCGHGGIGIVTWRLETLALMKALNIEPRSDLFMEMRPLVDGNKVYKYCKLKDGTNIAIEFESD